YVAPWTAESTTQGVKSDQNCSGLLLRPEDRFWVDSDDRLTVRMPSRCGVRSSARGGLNEAEREAQRPGRFPGRSERLYFTNFSATSIVSKVSSAARSQPRYPPV